MIDRGGPLVRLDIIDGRNTTEPMLLRFDIVGDEHLPVRLAAIQQLIAQRPIQRRHHQFARRILGLQALDAQRMGASLKEIADLLMEPGDWPGDGEHRKSLVRRLVHGGEKLMQLGSPSVLRD